MRACSLDDRQTRHRRGKRREDGTCESQKKVHRYLCLNSYTLNTVSYIEKLKHS